MKKQIFIMLMIILIGSWTLLLAGPNDTEEEEQQIKIEFINFLNTSTDYDYNLGDVYNIVTYYNAEYINKVMIMYVHTIPSPDLWEQFLEEFFPMWD